MVLFVKSIAPILILINCSSQDISESKYIVGHSRLITNGLTDNQPVVRGDILVVHNGIVVNDVDIWNKIGLQRLFDIDSEVIAAIAENHLFNGGDLETLQSYS